MKGYIFSVLSTRVRLQKQLTKFKDAFNYRLRGEKRSGMSRRKRWPSSSSRRTRSSWQTCCPAEVKKQILKVSGLVLTNSFVTYLELHDLLLEVLRGLLVGLQRGLRLLHLPRLDDLLRDCGRATRHTGGQAQARSGQQDGEGRSGRGYRQCAT